MLPNGRGPVNQAGLDYYRALVDELRAHGIVPVATVYHWELPQALEDEGGWASRDTAELLAQYAGVLADALGDRVGMWTTLNEPKQSVHQGYRVGTHAPGHRDMGLAAAATHHILLGHGLALQALRAALPATVPVGIALDPHPYRPLGEDAEAVVAQLDADHNRICSDPVLHGTLPRARPTRTCCRPTRSSARATWRRSARRWTSSASTTTGPTTSAAATGQTCGSASRRCPISRASSSTSRPSGRRP